MNNNSLLCAVFHKWDDEANLFKTMCLITVSYSMVLAIAVICEAGARMTNEFEAFDEELGQCNWYELPIELQRMYMMFVVNTQSPIEISSYGGLVCSRETFKKVRLAYRIALEMSI